MVLEKRYFGRYLEVLLQYLKRGKFSSGLMVGKDLAGSGQKGAGLKRGWGKTEHCLAPGRLSPGNFERKVQGRGLRHRLVEACFGCGPIITGGQKAGAQALSVQV